MFFTPLVVFFGKSKLFLSDILQNFLYASRYALACYITDTNDSSPSTVTSTNKSHTL